MKKGTLTTLSALPAEDTENHHHTTIKKRGGAPVLSPKGPTDCCPVCWKTYGESHDFFLQLQERLLIQEEWAPLPAMSSKIRIHYFWSIKMSKFEIGFAIEIY